MEERYLKFEDLMADLAAYLVSEYDIEPRDAAGLVMNSPLTQELYAPDSLDHVALLAKLATKFFNMSIYPVLFAVESFYLLRLLGYEPQVFRNNLSEELFASEKL